MSPAATLQAICNPSTPYTDRLIALRAAWDEDDREPSDYTPVRPGRCRCFGPGEGPGRCPGPDSCPLCEGDEE
jgi:hypothetical protein